MISQKGTIWNEYILSLIFQSKRLLPNLSAIRLESWIGFLSSFSEAYNMALMPFLAPALGPLLFKNTSQTESIFFSYFLIFLGSFVMCPLGAWYYGSIGDKQGRRPACIFSSFGLASVTGVMAFLPIDSLGHYAWILFLIFLSLQFFFSAGEYYSSIVFSLEHGTQSNQGLMSGLSCFFSVLGLLFANFLSILVMKDPHLISWRLPFVVGLLTGLLSFSFKFYCKESPYFQYDLKENKNISWNFIKENFRNILSIILVTGLFYTLYSYIFLYLPLVDKTIDSAVEWQTFICLIIYGIGLVLSGFLSDKYEVKKTMIFGVISIFIILLSFIFLNSVSFFIRLLLVSTACIYIGPIHSWTVSQVSPDKRCRIIALSTTFAGAIFSNSCVPLCMLIYQKLSSLWISNIYVIALSIIVFFILLPDHKKYK